MSTRIDLICDGSGTYPRLYGWDDICDIWLCAQTDEAGEVYVTYPATGTCASTTKVYVCNSGDDFWVNVPDCDCTECECAAVASSGYYPVLNMANLTWCNDDTPPAWPAAIMGMTGSPIALSTASSCAFTAERFSSGTWNGTDYFYKGAFSLTLSASFVNTGTAEDPVWKCRYDYVISITFHYREDEEDEWMPWAISGNGFIYNSANHRTNCSGPSHYGFAGLVAGQAGIHNWAYDTAVCTPPSVCNASQYAFIGTLDLSWVKP